MASAWIAGAQLVQRLGLGVELGPDASGPCARRPGRSAAGSCCRRRGCSASSAGVTSGSLPAPSPRARRRARRRAGPSSGGCRRPRPAGPAPSSSTMCRWPSISTTAERDARDRLGDLHRDQELGRVADAPDELALAASRRRSMPWISPAASGCSTSTSMNATQGAAWQARSPTLTPGQPAHPSTVSASSGYARQSGSSDHPALAHLPAPCRARLDLGGLVGLRRTLGGIVRQERQQPAPALVGHLRASSPAGPRGSGHHGRGARGVRLREAAGVRCGDAA